MELGVAVYYTRDRLRDVVCAIGIQKVDFQNLCYRLIINGALVVNLLDFMPYTETIQFAFDKLFLPHIK